MKVPSSNYPTIIAAFGLVPPQVLLSIVEQYRHEIRNMDRTGKLALTKLLRMADEEMEYAKYLDRRCQYRLSFNASRLKLKRSLESIPCDRPI